MSEKKKNKKEKNLKGFEEYTVIRPDVSYWNPKEAGEELEGTYTESYKGTKHTRYILKDKEGQSRILPDTFYIRKLFEEDKIQIGDLVKIRYLSKKSTDSGTKIYDYTVGTKPQKGGSNE